MTKSFQEKFKMTKSFQEKIEELQDEIEAWNMDIRQWKLWAQECRNKGLVVKAQNWEKSIEMLTGYVNANNTEIIKLHAAEVMRLQRAKEIQ